MPRINSDSLLEEQLRIAHNLLQKETTPDEARRLAQLVLALDNWINEGGEFPFNWRYPRKHCHP